MTQPGSADLRGQSEANTRRDEMCLLGVAVLISAGNGVGGRTRSWRTIQACAGDPTTSRASSSSSAGSP